MLVLVAPLGAALGAAASSSTAATRWTSDFDTLGQQFLDGVSELGRRAAEAGDALQRLLPGAGSATSAAAHDALPIEGVWLPSPVTAHSLVLTGVACFLTGWLAARHTYRT